MLPSLAKVVSCQATVLTVLYRSVFLIAVEWVHTEKDGFKQNPDAYNDDSQNQSNLEQ